MKLYVGNLPYQATEAELQQWLAQAGVTADTVTMVRDRMTGGGRGFGFIEIHDQDAAEQAIRVCNGREFMGRSLVVNEARPPSEHRSPGRGGSGGRPPSRGRGGPRRPPRW
ncbi:MAG: RNA-binding protein [Bryobacteraceae bacterium]|jgi:RNA recognition motif-containing protein|nr:RNA-binding protein [Bryobacteraceae bacterium]